MIQDETRKEYARIAEIRFAMVRLFPFLGHLLANIPIELASVGTACATNEGRFGKIYVDPAFSLGLDRGQLLGVMLHEVHHIAFGAFHRQRWRDMDGWNQAIDHSDNLMIAEMIAANPHLGIRFWDEPAPLKDYAFRGKTAETIYDLLVSEQQQDASPKPEPEASGDGGEGEAGGESEAEREREEYESSTGEGQGGEGQGEARDQQPGDGAGEPGANDVPADSAGDGDGEAGGCPGGAPGGSSGSEGSTSGRDGDGAEGSQAVAPRHGGRGVLDATDLVRVPRGLTEDEERAMDEVQAKACRNLLVEAMELQSRSGAGTMPGSLVERIEVELRPPYVWIDYLLQRVSGYLRGGIETYAHPSRRSAVFEDEGEGLVLPGMGRQRPRVALIADDSQSVGSDELKEFVAVTRQVVESVDAEVRWIQVSDRITFNGEIDDFDLAVGQQIPFYGRGGTIFDEVPGALEGSDEFEPVDLAILLTDGEPVRWPRIEDWPCPVIVVTTRTLPPPEYDAVKLEVLGHGR